MRCLPFLATIIVMVPTLGRADHGLALSHDIRKEIRQLCDSTSVESLQHGMAGNGDATQFHNNFCSAAALAAAAAVNPKNLTDVPPDLYLPGFCAALVQIQGIGEVEKFKVYCKPVGARTGGVESIVLTAAQGLGDFLVARAQDELTAYAVGNLGHALCDDAKVKLLFKRSCDVAFPGGKFAFDKVITNKFKSALSDDLKTLPLNIIDLVPLPAANDGKAWTIVAKKLVAGIFSVGSGQTQLIDIFEVVGKSIDDAFTQQGISMSCDFSLAGTHPSVSCIALLLIEVGRDGLAPVKTSSEPLSLANLIPTTAARFCKHYGPVTDRKDETDPDAANCIFGKDHKGTSYLSQWHDKLLKLAEAFDEIIVLQKTISQMKNVPPSEIVQRAAPDTIKALGDALSAIFNAAGVDSSGDVTAIIQACQSASLIAVAISTRDIASVERAIADLLDNPKVKAVIPEKMSKPIIFIVDLASAKDRDEAKKIIADAAAPMGSYRIKYGRNVGWTVTVQGYVGFFGGGQRNFSYRSDNPDIHQLDSALKVTAPVGFDFTPSFFSGEKNHFGFGVTILDPLAISTINADGKQASTDWGSLLTPGAYIRWGIWQSPVALIGGVSYHPFLKSNDTCSGVPCWNGALQFGVSLAVDVPIFILN